MESAAKVLQENGVLPVGAQQPYPEIEAGGPAGSQAAEAAADPAAASTGAPEAPAPSEAMEGVADEPQGVATGDTGAARSSTTIRISTLGMGSQPAEAQREPQGPAPGAGAGPAPAPASGPANNAVAGAQPGGPAAATNQERPSSAGQGGPAHPQLNDALAYLERVKAEFNDQPEIYNKFLQIMRDFKANAIDSNGVIYRLVHLFMGHQSLIAGFNAFLPKTHHIDPHVAETGILPPHIIQAAVHSGLVQTHPPTAQMLGQARPAAIPGHPGAPTINLSHFVNPASLPAAAAWNVEQPPSQQGYYGPGPLPTYPNPPQHRGAPADVRAPVVAPAQPEAKKPSPQFNKAIGYVKKIRNRFSNDPETYKAFLAALHSYHKEQLSIHEVYEQVSVLFLHNSDLLAEFMQFLPEQDAAAIISKSTRHAEAQAPAMGRFGDISLASRRGGAGSGASKAVKRARAAAQMLAASPSTAGYVTTHRSPEENEFFEKVKAFLGNKSVYAEFLKCLNLFSQDILKLDDLLRLVNGFIGGSDELYGWFKRYIGLKEPTLTGTAAEPGSWRGTAAGINAEIQDLNLHACKRIGSYRVFPRAHRLVKASGRTALCEEVLNDVMLSCPTFTSEDSTFVGSKKNQFEEALFKCEDERYELDLLIDHNLATIAVFEPLAKRFEAMPLEERAGQQLPSNLGGTSEVIYRKAIRKVYGDKAEDMVAGLRRSPAVALPVVLARLKQKDEEWRRMQRDWNKVWRDIHLKNHYKALDHQGLEFKAADRRNFALKSLTGEMEALQAEARKQRDRERLVGAAVPVAAGPNHLEFGVKEPGRLLEDLVRLIKVHLRNTSGITSADRKAVLEFFSTFVPEFFAYRRGAEGAPDTELHSEDEDELELPRARLAQAADAAAARLLFANSTLFGFMRLVEMALERLDKMRAAALGAQGSAQQKDRSNVVAGFLDLQTREKFPELGQDYYRSLLYLLKQLLYGDLEPSAFEEQARFMFGNDAYAMYTFDKLVQAIVKQAQTVLLDPCCEQLIRLFDSGRLEAAKAPSKLSEYSLRLAAENLLGTTGALFRVEWVPRTGRIGFQLLERLFDSAGGSVEAKWSAYVDGFVKLDTNPAYLNPRSKVFLKRCLRSRSPAMDDEAGLLVDYNLECKICINTYKLFYVENTEDTLMRTHSARVCSPAGAKRRFGRWWAQEWEALGNGPIPAANDAFSRTFSL